jgi:hypothetical protein
VEDATHGLAQIHLMNLTIPVLPVGCTPQYAAVRPCIARISPAWTAASHTANNDHPWPVAESAESPVGVPHPADLRLVISPANTHQTGDLTDSTAAPGVHGHLERGNARPSDGLMRALAVRRLLSTGCLSPLDYEK